MIRSLSRMLEYLLLTNEVEWSTDVVLSDDSYYLTRLTVNNRELLNVVTGTKTGFRYSRVIIFDSDINAVARCGEIVLARISNACWRYNISDDRLLTCRLVTL